MVTDHMAFGNIGLWEDAGSVIADFAGSQRIASTHTKE